MTGRDWVAEAETLFQVNKPGHFTDYRHCCECAEHDETLRSSDRESIGLEELGSPAWDPLCFCSVEGLLYYTPALIRLSLESVNSDFYFSQYLFHLDGDGPGNRYMAGCSTAQRRFLAEFIEYMILTYPDQLEVGFDQDTALRVAEMWSAESA